MLFFNSPDEVAEADGKMKLTLSRGASGDFAEASVNILLLKTTTADQAGIEASEDVAKTLFKDTAAFVHIEPDENTVKTVIPGKVYKLEVPTAKTKNSITFTIGGIEEDANHKANYVMFSEHLLSEFDHSLKSSSAGEDIAPLATEPAMTTPVAPSPAGSGSSSSTLSIFVSFLTVVFAFFL